MACAIHLKFGESVEGRRRTHAASPRDEPSAIEPPISCLSSRHQVARSSPAAAAHATRRASRAIPARGAPLTTHFPPQALSHGADRVGAADPAQRNGSRRAAEGGVPHGGRPCAVPLVVGGRVDHGVCGEAPADRDHLLHQRVQGAAARRVDPRDAGHPRDGGRAAPARRQPDRQLAREADEREGLHQARPRQGGAGPAAGGGRPADPRRRRGAAHHRRRRHEHVGRRPLGVPPEGRVLAHGDRAAEDRRQRRVPHPAVARRVDRRRAGRALL